jgi:hypothetical protein
MSFKATVKKVGNQVQCYAGDGTLVMTLDCSTNEKNVLATGHSGVGDCNGLFEMGAGCRY